jgi:hypothetical protein
MTALSIQPTYPIFTDIDGQPLEDGYVWIGVANLAPIVNPITVYWDAALTIPAVQPIRTRGGYPVNSGTPARLYVNSDYSIQVQNRNGSVVYSAPMATERYSDVVIDDISSANVSFLQAGIGAVLRTAQSKMREIVSVTDFGADPTGAADSTAAIQAAWDSIKSANGTLFFPKGTYRCDGVLSFTVNYVSNNHFHAVVGDCATIDFSNTALTTGNMITFGSGLGLFEEKSRFFMEGLSLIGPSLGTINPTGAPPRSLIGIFFNYAINLTLRNITAFNFYVGYKVDFCFPIVAEAVLSDNCYVGLQLVGDVTCSSWVGCSFKEGRFGVVIQPKTNTKNIYGQTFIRPLLEGNDVAMVIDPLDGSGAGAWDIDIIDPYIEAVTYDAFRIGRAIDYDDATATGADRNRNVYNFRLTGGLWDGQWGTAGHQPVLFHAVDSSDAPAGCVVDIPVQLSTSSIGFARKSQFNGRIEIFVGSSSVITDETQYQRKAPSVAVDFVQFPATQVPSANANALDDYEEGTWTPTITFATPGDLSVTYATQNGRYTKIGDVVIANIDIQTATFTHTTASGALRVSLPFAVNAAIVPTSGGIFQGWTAAGYMPSIQGDNGSAFATPRAQGSGVNLLTLGAAHFTTGGTVRVQATLVYKV